MDSQYDDMSDIATTYLEYSPLVNSTPEDQEARSPRTPVWGASAILTPFDLDRYFPRSSHPPQMKAAAPPPPDLPLPWVWQCHLCRHRYPLGVTRRCLYDGHYYCSGETNVKNLKKKKKGQACSSEFDYEGWDEYGEWKRKALQMTANTRVPSKCETCDFPSMCRTAVEQYPVKKERKSVTSPPSLFTPNLELPKKSNIQIDFQLPSAQELLALEEGEKDDLLRAAGSSCAKADKSVDFEKILAEARRQEEEMRKNKQKQSKMTDFLKVKTSSKKDKTTEKRSAAASLTLNLEHDRQRKSSASDFVMPSLDFWGKSSKAKGP
jgi:hypothetical protein